MYLNFRRFFIFWAIQKWLKQHSNKTLLFGNCFPVKKLICFCDVRLLQIAERYTFSILTNGTFTHHVSKTHQIHRNVQICKLSRKSTPKSSICRHLTLFHKAIQFFNLGTKYIKSIYRLGTNELKTYNCRNCKIAKESMDVF